MNWSEEHVLALSPDASSTKAGKDLAKPDKWLTLGIDARALWGEIKGSGSNPYRIQIDLKNTAFKCSCPSRKFPCKHGLGLFLIFARSPERFKESEEPEWVKEWIEKRQEKEEKKVESAEKPVDEKAQAKRAEARAKKVSEGVEEISLWIKDLIRNGLLTVPEKAYSFWQNPAARMVDAQAPGLAGMIRSLGSINFFKEGWQGELLTKLVQIYLVTEGYKNINQLPEQLQNEVKSLIGWSQSQEELKSYPGVKDEWLVMSKHTEQQDSLFIQTHWLFGRNSLKHALILNFYHKSQPTDPGLVPGTQIDGELVFYPGAFPLRAIIKERKATYPLQEPSTFLTFSSVQQQFAEVLAQSPWIDKIPAFIENAVPHVINNRWFLVDQENSLIEIDKSFTSTWKLAAISGGKAKNMYGLYSKNSFTPLVIWQESQYLQL